MKRALISRFGTINWLREMPGLVVVVVATIVYVLIVPQTVLGGDNGEFALLAHAEGIAHPPGYPLYVAYLRLMRWLPAATPAQVAGWATALLAGAQLAVLYWACRLWGAIALAAAIAVGVYAGSPLAIHHFTHAEVFALNGLLVAAVLAVCAPRDWLSPRRRVLLLALLCGLGTAHHHSLALLAPSIAYGLFAGFCASPRSGRWRVFGLALVASLIGFSPNLLLFHWSQQQDVYLQSWGLIRGWSEFWHHFLRIDYGTFTLASPTTGDRADLGLNLRNLLNSLANAWPLLIPFSGLGFYLQLRRLREHDHRWFSWLALLASFLMAGPVFLSRANIDPGTSVVGWEVLERFYILPALLLVIPVAFGLGVSGSFLISWMGRLWRCPLNLSRPMRAALCLIAALYAFVFNAAVSIASTGVRRGSLTQDYIVNAFSILPKNAVVIAISDDEMFASSYLQNALSFRPDVTVIHPSFVGRPWYQERLRRRLPDCRLNSGRLTQNIGAILSTCKRPLFVSLPYYWARKMKAMNARYESYQYGTWRRFLSDADTAPSPGAVFALNERLFQGFRMPQRPVSLGNGWASRPARIYVLSWKTLARDMARASRPDLAQKALKTGPRYGPCLWGDCLGD